MVQTGIVFFQPVNLLIMLQNVLVMLMESLLKMGLIQPNVSPKMFKIGVELHLLVAQPIQCGQHLSLVGNKHLVPFHQSVKTQFHLLFHVLNLD